MAMKKILFWISLSIFLGACGPTVPYFYKTYRLKDSLSVSVGNPVLAIEEGRSRGYLRAGHKYELIYKGILNDVMTLVYREYTVDTEADYIKPAYSMEVSYDLTKGGHVEFRDFIIRVLEATSQRLTYVILEEPIGYRGRDNRGDYAGLQGQWVRMDVIGEKSELDTVHLWNGRYIVGEIEVEMTDKVVIRDFGRMEKKTIKLIDISIISRRSGVITRFSQP